MDLLLAFNGIPLMILLLGAGALFFFVMKNKFKANKQETKDIED